MAVQPTENQLGLVLHTRDFSDSKKLLTLFCAKQGKISVLYRVSKRKPCPKPFALLVFTWAGKSNLKNLYSAEESQAPFQLLGKPLFCAMYLNELLVRLLAENHPATEIFNAYSETLAKLTKVGESDGAIQEVLLRRFEFALLRSLGFAIQLDKDSAGVAIIDAVQVYYRYDAGVGFVRCESPPHDDAGHQHRVFDGASILAVANEQWSDAARSAAKRLSRLVLTPLLGHKPIKARELFI